MQAVDFSQHSYNPAAQGPSAAAASAQAASPDSALSFDDLLAVVNPLQHFPVVGTLYRALTGDTIKTPEKIAGDTLYGGLPGFVSSVADTAFEKITGKNIGDTVLAFLTGNGEPVNSGVASAEPAAVAPAQGLTTPDVAALMQSLSQSGVDTDTATRALSAYRSTKGFLPNVPITPST
jgi:hypothetical protein